MSECYFYIIIISTLANLPRGSTCVIESVIAPGKQHQEQDIRKPFYEEICGACGLNLIVSILGRFMKQTL